jgi:hypothetical protein
MNYRRTAGSTYFWVGQRAYHFGLILKKKQTISGSCETKPAVNHSFANLLTALVTIKEYSVMKWTSEFCGKTSDRAISDKLPVS